MKIVIADLSKADKFVTLFQQMKSFTDCINIQLQQEQLFLQSIDANRVSIFELYLPKEWFDEYTIDDGCEMGVYTNLLNNVFQTRHKHQSITLHDEDGCDKLGISFSSEQDTIQKDFVLPLFDLDVELMGIPEMDHHINILMDSGLFSENMKQLKLFGDNISFQCKEDSISFCSPQDDNGKMNVCIPKSELIEYKHNQSIQMSFSTNILNQICSFQKLNKHIHVSITDAFPLNITLHIDPENSDAKIVFYIAPLIE